MALQRVACGVQLLGVRVRSKNEGAHEEKGSSHLGSDRSWFTTVLLEWEAEAHNDQHVVNMNTRGCYGLLLLLLAVL